MTTTELIAKVRRDYPRQKLDTTKDDVTVENNPNILLELNLAQTDICYWTNCIPYNNDDDENGYNQNLTADKQRFALHSSQINIDMEGGVWYKDSGDDWFKLTQMSRKTLDLDFPRWMDASSSECLYYFFEGGYINVYPKCSEARENGLKIFGGVKADELTENAQVPFNTFSHLVAYHTLLSLYVGMSIQAAASQWETRDKIVTEYATRVAAMNADLHGKRFNADYNQDVSNIVGYHSHFSRR